MFSPHWTEAKSMTTNVTIRNATPADAAALLDIYAPYVRETAVTFECDPPSVEDFTARIASTIKRYPYLVAEHDGVPVGYAYASPFKGRSAYDWSVELSIYVERDSRRSGIGRALYTAIAEELRDMGIVNLYACIATAECEDEYVSFGSMRFHERMGFSLAARFSQVACKFGRWYVIVWMYKPIGDHAPNPSPVNWKSQA